ncbi:NAD(P)H-quinone oxidoreductase [Risungbinella massiliensis]|uniref:NAD(P)H-quinone oxidoreductase n=1 Tax=Risungbinella massiliensis TaxID=1329796 RepID=UPI0005CBE7B7|nr:NAD(P)H-quinone oxidoreductase [Risungbinella massiliensis]
MKAIIVRKPGGRENLEFGVVPMPNPKAEEVRIHVKAIGINRADILQREGNYPAIPGTSPLLGLEVSGEIVETGDRVTDWKVGDRVCTLLPGGGYAEYAVAPTNMLISIPDEMNYEEAAAIPEVFLTAYQSLFWIGRLQEGEGVCIHAGASGVGTAAIQLAKAKGAKVIVTVGSKEKQQFCKELGAELAILYKEQDFAEEILSYTNSLGVDLILDFVGANYWEQNLRCLAMDGRLVLISFLSGAKLEKTSLAPLLSKRLQVTGTTLKTRDLAYKSELVHDLQSFVSVGLKDGSIRPIIHQVYDWTEVQRAHEEMEENRNIGKLILRVTN